LVTLYNVHAEKYPQGISANLIKIVPHICCGCGIHIHSEFFQLVVLGY